MGSVMPGKPSKPGMRVIAELHDLIHISFIYSYVYENILHILSVLFAFAPLQGPLFRYLLHTKKIFVSDMLRYKVIFLRSSLTKVISLHFKPNKVVRVPWRKSDPASLSQLPKKVLDIFNLSALLLKLKYNVLCSLINFLGHCSQTLLFPTFLDILRQKKKKKITWASNLHGYCTRNHEQVWSHHFLTQENGTSCWMNVNYRPSKECIFICNIKEIKIDICNIKYIFCLFLIHKLRLTTLLTLNSKSYIKQNNIQKWSWDRPP